MLLPVQSGNGRIDVDLGGLGLQAGTPYRLHVFSDRTPTIYDVALAFGATPDLAESNDTIDTAFRLEAIQQIAQVSGLRLQSATDQDWFAFTLPEEDPEVANPAHAGRTRSASSTVTGGPYTFQLLKADGTVRADGWRRRRADARRARRRASMRWPPASTA